MKTLTSIVIWVYWCFLFLFFFILISIVFLATFPFDRYRKIPNWVLSYLGVGLLKSSPNWNISIEGQEKYDSDQPTIFVANHQSFLDMALIYHLPWQMKWVSKRSMLYFPVMGWLVWLTGHLTINRGSKTALKRLENLVKPLKDHVPVMIFPEGTRSLDGDIRAFKNGPFLLSLEHGFAIQPIVIDGGYDAFPSGAKSFKMNVNFRISVLDSIDVTTFSGLEPLKKHVRSLMIDELSRLRSEPKLPEQSQ
ncbi:MAG: lysophospholipid acyltransferase family protein [Bacteroidota bacterium]